MGQLQIIDTMPDFLTYWQRYADAPLDTQITAWAGEYMTAWPELLAKQQDDYAAAGEDWRQVARAHVFPALAARLPAMREARANLLAVCEPVYAAAQAVLGPLPDVVMIIYVGIGLGAGWVTTYGGQPAVLFGLENIAECGWSAPAPLRGLIAHELGHVAHFHWWDATGRPRGDGPFWQLYTEGFAQRCEPLITQQAMWHMMVGAAAPGWLDWCTMNRDWLALEFLRVVEAGEPVRDFFGSWYDLHGHSQTGYYLGHAIIERWQAALDLREIAVLPDYESRLRETLAVLAGDAAPTSEG